LLGRAASVTELPGHLAWGSGARTRLNARRTDTPAPYDLVMPYKYGRHLPPVASPNGARTMPDRTTFQAFVYACPEDQRQAAHRVLTQNYRLGLAWDATAPGQLSLTEPYTARVFLCRYASEVATVLHEAAPGASFYLWE